MQPSSGKREIHKRNTRRVISAAAMRLFLEHGYEAVTTSAVAEAAGVSPATLFNYFDTKEDLFFGQVHQLERRLMHLVNSCPPGESILRRLQANVIWELTAGRVDSEPAAIAPFHHQVVSSPRLQAREHEIYDQREQVLNEALLRRLGDEPLTARVAAHLYVAAEQIIAAELRSLLTHVDVTSAIGQIELFTDQVFDILGAGVGDLTASEDVQPKS